MSAGLGWLSESAVLPRKPHQIDEVGQASMVDLKAQLFASEEHLRSIQADPAARAAEQRRREASHAADPLGTKNRGVSERARALSSIRLPEPLHDLHRF